MHFSPPKILYPFLFTPIFPTRPSHISLYFVTQICFMNNKYHKVLLCVILSSRQLYPPTYPTHFPLHSVFEHSQPMSFPATCFLFTHFCVPFFIWTAGSVWCIRNLMAATLKWELPLFSCIRLRLS